MALVTELTELIGLHLGLRTVKLTDRLIEDLGAESVDIVNIIATAEERYGITINDERMNRIRTAGDLLEYIRSVIES